MNDDFRIVKDAINLADYIGRYAPLKRAGQLMTCNCPLPGHDDRSPSFQVKEDHWICRGKCGIGGDIFDFVQAMHGWDKATALTELAREYNITLTPLSAEHAAKQGRRERLYALLNDTAVIYQTWLFEEHHAPVLAYLTDTRGLSLEAVKAAGLGYAGKAAWNAVSCGHLAHMGYSDDEMIDAGIAKRGHEGKLYDTFRNRVIIPIRDTKGRIVAFTGRAMDKDQSPKYLHNATIEGVFEKSKIVHRMPSNQSTIGFKASDTAIVVEGSIDPISGANSGFTNVVSLLGKSMSDEQLLLLCAPGITRLVFCLDNDQAGHEALKRLVVKHMHVAAQHGVDLYAMQAPFGKDPDDTFRERPELWQPAVDSARPVVDVLLERESMSLPKDPTPGQKQAWGVKLLPLLKGENGFVNEDNVKRLAAFLGSSIDTIEAWTRTQVTVMPKFIPAQTIDRSLPTNEEWVLHAIIAMDDDYLLERLNASLDIVTTEHLPYALAPLSLNDFTSKETRMVMAQIQTFIKSNDRPLYAALSAYFEGGNNQAVYERIARADARSMILGGPGAMTSHEAVEAAFHVRIARLQRDLADPSALLPRQECITGIVYLQLKLEDAGA